VRRGDLLREAHRALFANRSRTLLTGAGITVGTMALALILSLALGLDGVIDRLLTSDEQLRHVMVMPGYGGVGKAGAVPEIKGDMSDEKRARLRRALLKRGYGGPPFQIAIRMIDADTERELATLPGVESSRAFVQDRYGVEIVGAVPGAISPPAGAAPDSDAGTRGQVLPGTVRAPRDALSIAMPAKHANYPKRVFAGRWFASDDEQAAVVHEVLLYEMGLTSDEAQAAVVGRALRLTAHAGGGIAAMLPGLATPKSGGAELFHVDLPIVGVLRERFGSEPAAFVDEVWAMQADVFLPQTTARALWDRRPNREGPRSMLLVAKSTQDAAALEDSVAARGLQVRSVREAFDSIKKWLKGATVAAGFLSLVAVFVAALGIVNTMVMSVLERTREIGLLKSLGATNEDVASLFLAEASLLGLAGGVVGVGLSLALAALGNWFGRRMIEEAMMMPFDGTLFVFPWWLVAGGLAFSVTVGLVAALVPALRAARVDPVVALRHE
jgi:putative ABC transport system permease protein